MGWLNQIFFVSLTEWFKHDLNELFYLQGDFMNFEFYKNSFEAKKFKRIFVVL